MSDHKDIRIAIHQAWLDGAIEPDSIADAVIAHLYAQDPDGIGGEPPVEIVNGWDRTLQYQSQRDTARRERDEARAALAVAEAKLAHPHRTGKRLMAVVIEGCDDITEFNVLATAEDHKRLRCLAALSRRYGGGTGCMPKLVVERWWDRV